LLETFKLPKNAARLIVLQRIEIAGFFLKKIRKLFGRYLFSNLITKFFLNPNNVGKQYYERMTSEFKTLNQYIDNNDNTYLSIGCGMGGLESIINQNFKNKKYYFIEKNYISKKIKYGWTGMLSSEAYNDLYILKNFLKMNNMIEEQITIIDYDNDILPTIKFDVITSLFSLDYHYDFNLYKEYLKKVSTPKTKIIFDTIRADYFKKIFKNVTILKSDIETTHKSKRILCSQFFD